MLNETMNGLENQLSTANQTKLNSTTLTNSTNIRDQNKNKNKKRFYKMKGLMVAQFKY